MGLSGPSEGLWSHLNFPITGFMAVIMIRTRNLDYWFSLERRL